MPADLTLTFLNDLDAEQRLSLEDALDDLSLRPDQGGFSMPAPQVLAKTKADPTRDMFVILATVDGRRRPVGVGVLQPTDDREVTLRGFSIDPRWQGRGFGTLATQLACAAARDRYPDAATVRLSVHVDNEPGRRAYLRSGFSPTGEVVDGRAGQEHVMRRPLR